MEHLLKDTAERAWRYRRSLHDRTVAPTPEALANVRRLDEPLPEVPTDPEAVIAQLDELGSPATMASAGGRFFVRDPRHLHAAMAVNAPYLVISDAREPEHYTPDFSRRARGVEVWAALRSLGRRGLADLIERTCRHATRFAQGLRAAGYDILNDVVINQVLVSFGDAERTRRVIAAIQVEGTCWAGATVWQGHTAMRISVSSWATTDQDVERSLEAMIRVAAGMGATSRPR